jgi:DNA-binding XRE family transcriptional regulator
MRPTSSLSEFTKEFRRELGISQEALGSLIGVTQQYVSLAESDRLLNPLGFASRLMAVLDEKDQARLIDSLTEFSADKVRSKVAEKVAKRRIVAERKKIVERMLDARKG